MKISKLRTRWISLISSFVTGYYCLQAIGRGFSGKINRAWVDKAVYNWSSHLLDLIQVKCKVYNPFNVQPIPGRATIIMCNHTSLYDIPISFKAFPNYSIRMLAKKELSKIPLLGRGMTSAEFPFIDRKNRHQAIKDLAAAKQLMESGIIIWIAPEGTRSKDGKLAPFKKGGFITAIEAKAIIIPIGIRGAYDILPAKTMQLNLGQTAEVHIGKPIDASQYTMEQRDELVSETYNAISQLVEPATEYNEELQLSAI